MKKLACFAIVFLGLLVFSVDGAVAAQWRPEIGAVAAAPGALLPTLLPRCVVRHRLMSGETDEELADWLVNFLGAMTAEEVDAVLGEVDPEGTLGLTGEDLLAMSYEELVLLIRSVRLQNPSLFAALEAAKDTVATEPCGKAKHTAQCEDGYTCTTFTCKDKNGASGNCTTTHFDTVDWMFSACSNHPFIWRTYKCNDPCVPLSQWTVLAGAALAGWFFLAGRRRSANC
jgi:hypothetical protein